MRLIDADALQKEVNKHIKSTGSIFYKDVIDLIINAPTVQREGLESDAMRYRYIKSRAYSDMESWTLPEIQEPNDYKHSNKVSRLDYAIDKAMIQAAPTLNEKG